MNEEEDTQEADADSEKSQQERGNIKSQFYINNNFIIYLHQNKRPEVNTVVHTMLKCASSFIFGGIFWDDDSKLFI